MLSSAGVGLTGFGGHSLSGKPGAIQPLDLDSFRGRSDAGVGNLSFEGSIFLSVV